MLSTKHDIHCHSTLSLCCSDPACTAEAVYKIAEEKGYDTICLTNHLWDADVPLGDMGFYEPQTIDHVMQGKPYAKAEGVRALFGCETDYTGNGRLGLTKEHFDLFDFVVIPPNHMHMKGFVRPVDVTTAEQMAELYTCRLEEISQLDIPMEKVGIAHMNCTLLFAEGKASDVIKLMDEERLRIVFKRLAHRGAGIELNACDFGEFETDKENCLRLFKLAKEEGCKFYCASDSHSVEDYNKVEEVLPAVIEALGLEEEDRYLIP